MSLHDELMLLNLTDWHIYTIVHCMIDLEMITTLECQHPTCVMPSRKFAVKATRGQRDGLVLDHIVPRRAGGLHHIDNLRVTHNACNAAWRRGEEGSFHTEISRELVREATLRQHQEGRAQDYADPQRNAKISVALTGRMSEPARRGWETRRRG